MKGGGGVQNTMQLNILYKKMYSNKYLFAFDFLQIEVFQRHFADLVYNYGDQVLINLVCALCSHSSIM